MLTEELSLLSDVQDVRTGTLPGYGAFYSGLLKGALLHDSGIIKNCTNYRPDDWTKLSLREIRTICLTCEFGICKTKELIQESY